jgi:hypothetical protein
MFSSPTLSHFSFSIILWQTSSYSQDSTSMMGMSMWYILLVPFLILMVVLGGCRSTNDSDEEIEVDNTYHGDEEEMEGDDDNENDSDDVDEQKPKEISTPLCKYVTRLGEEKGVE